MEQELKNSQQALIDKICIYGFCVTGIKNIDDLITRNVATVKEGQKQYLAVGVSSILISEAPYFDRFECAMGPEGVAYSRMELSIPGDDGYHNLNCHELWQCRQQIADAVQYLYTEYGISVTECDLRIKSIEINKTIPIDYPFEAYQRPLALMMHLFPGTLRMAERDYHERSQHPDRAEDNQRIVRTFEKTSGKRGLTVKVYDKTTQLNNLAGKDKLDEIIRHPYLRFEITLPSAEKIRKALGSNHLDELTDQKIQEYFDTFITDNVSKVYEAYNDKRHKAIRRIMRDTYAPNSHTWVRDTLLRIMNVETQTNLPLMLDIDEAITLLMNNAIPFKGKYKAQKKHNAILQFRSVCDRYTPVMAQGDLTKYQELLSKLGKAPSSGVADADTPVYGESYMP